MLYKGRGATVIQLKDEVQVGGSRWHHRDFECEGFRAAQAHTQAHLAAKRAAARRSSVKPGHILLATLAAAIWGFNFVVIRWGLGTYPPLLLAALRFAVAALPALWLPRPGLSWGQLVLIGSVWFLGQFAFLFTGMRVGMPPGLASVVMQAQAFLTILLAAWALNERPGGRQILGVIVATGGLLAIGSTATGSGSDMTTAGLALVLAGATSWALGNVLLRRAGRLDMLAAVVWLSLIPPLPLVFLSLAIDGPDVIAAALAQWDWSGLGSVLYLGLLATVVGFGIWGQLLKLYPAGLVAPFSLLVPVFGVLSSALVFGERFGPARLLGMGLVVLGLAVLALPGRWLGIRSARPE
jgi:O-acetylserine/cysteine efflux transporter